MESVFSPNKLTLSAQTQIRRVAFSFNPYLFPWAFFMAHSVHKHNPAFQEQFPSAQYPVFDPGQLSCFSTLNVTGHYDAGYMNMCIIIINI
jgi:hypothetical protein